MDFLENIVKYKKEINAKKKGAYQRLKVTLSKNDYSRYSIFKKAISSAGKINLIAEIKKASPSKGLLRADFDVGTIANIYAKGGAAAISVLTEDKYFLGKPLYVKTVSEKVQVPVLTKDFIIDEGQIYEARLNGASAVLLIVAILTDLQIKEFLAVATALDLDCLVEVHNEEELKRALGCGAEIIGINNRNLHTFEVDLKVSETLIPQIPAGKVIVAESGIKSYEDIKRLKEAGANAVLIGETFMREEDIAKKVKDVMQGEI